MAGVGRLIAPPRDSRVGQRPLPPSAAQPITNGITIASLVLGIVGAVTFGAFLIPSIPTMIFGHVAMRTINSTGGVEEGRGMAIADLIAG